MEETLRKQTESGIFWVLFERILGWLVSFGVSIILARLLTPSEYGTVSVATLFITLSTAVSSSGFTTVLIQKKNADKLDFNTIFWFNLLFAGVLYTILFFTAPYIETAFGSEGSADVLRVLGISLFISAWNNVQHAYISRHMAFKKFFFSSLGGTIASAVVGITMAYMGYGVWALVAQSLTDAIIDAIVLAFFVKWHPRFQFSWSRFKPLFQYGWKISAASLSGTFFDELRSFVIGLKYTTADLAYMNKGVSLPNMFKSNVQNTLSSVLFPSYSKMQDDKGRMKEAMKKSIKFSAFILFPIMAGIAAVAPTIVNVLYTEKWASAAPYMQMAAAIGLISVLGMIDDQCYKATGNTRTLLVLEFIKKPILVGITIGMMFIGPEAIMAGMVLYDAIGTIINSIATKKIIGYGLWERIKDVAPTLLVSIAMFIGVFFMNYIPLNEYALLAIQVVTGVLVYAICARIFFWDLTKEVFGDVKKLLKHGKKEIAAKSERPVEAANADKGENQNEAE